MCTQWRKKFWLQILHFPSGLQHQGLPTKDQKTESNAKSYSHSKQKIEAFKIST
jgi:hypothetical protein